MLSYILYEDVLSFRLNPLVRLMPVFSLRTCGLELHQVWNKHLDNDAIALCTRNLLSERTEELFTGIPVNTLPSDEFIAINARLLPDYMSRAAIESLQVGQVIVCQDVPMAARLSVDQSDALINTSEGWFIDTDNLNILRNDELQVIRFAWDLPGYVDSMLTIERDHLDFVPLTNKLLGVHFINPENIYI
ncbi:MAG TPA: putative sugar nucleotidyl transferase, partial [Bacteroidales bacterium]|nr:putative sugar nucleotidyl transferase [Bacteroidales bacterium]